ncbi:GFA family protein [Acidisoma cellulosilyticum]
MDGSCHCGAVHWRFEGVPTSATGCNCSLCRRYGALWAYGFEGEAFTVSRETETYVWNRKLLAFHFCARCACVVAWLATSRGQDERFTVRSICASRRMPRPLPPFRLSTTTRSP